MSKKQTPKEQYELQKALVVELVNINREIKSRTLTLLEKMAQPNMTKEKAADELFKIFRLMK